MGFDDDLFGMLQGDGEVEAPPMPVGGDFAPTGLIGPANTMLRWTLGTHDDLSAFEELPDASGMIEFQSGWKKYYFDNPEKADVAKRMAGNGIVNEVWRIEMDATQVLNAHSDTFAEKWGGLVSGDVDMGSLSAFKHRYAFHQLALPAFVDAFARAVGYISEPIFTFGELIDPDIKFDDNFQEKMIGLLVRGFDFRATETWKRRTALWAALGEENADAYTIINAGTPFDTTSEKLSRILSLIQIEPWKAPLWVRLFLCPDPRVDAISSGSNRLTVPVIQEVFKSREAANEAAQLELAESEGEQQATPKTAKGKNKTKQSDPPVPEKWAEYADSWVTELQRVKAKANGKLPPVPELAEIAKTILDVTTDDIRAWWDLV